MNNVELLKAMDRMCDETLCSSCPVNNVTIDGKRRGCKVLRRECPEKFLAIVEKWAEEHPLKTRQSEILKMCPNAKLGPDGVLSACPNEFDHGMDESCIKKVCAECKKEFWLKEISEE